VRGAQTHNKANGEEPALPLGGEKRCLAISSSPVGQNRVEGNEAAVFLTAIAASKNCGVISDHRSNTFSTVYDLCQQFGVPVLSAEGYFAAAL
jgi:hypothetical protein